MMLCSDGLVGVVTDEEIGGGRWASIDDPAEAARILIEMANGAGGPDNITVIVAHVDGPGLPEATDADALDVRALAHRSRAAAVAGEPQRVLRRLRAAQSLADRPSIAWWRRRRPRRRPRASRPWS